MIEVLQELPIKFEKLDFEISNSKHTELIKNYSLYHISQISQKSECEEHFNSIIEEINSIDIKSNPIIVDLFNSNETKFYIFTFDQTILIIDLANLQRFEKLFTSILRYSSQSILENPKHYSINFISKQYETEFYSDIFKLFSNLKNDYPTSNEKKIIALNQEISSLQKSDHFKLKSGDIQSVKVVIIQS